MMVMGPDTSIRDHVRAAGTEPQPQRFASNNVMTEFRTEQDAFWAGTFGDQYVDRNSDPSSVARRTAFFATVLSRTSGVRSVLELGANVGHNLWAINNLLPDCRFTAVEVNRKAVENLREVPRTRVLPGSIFDFDGDELGIHDLTFTAGVLIHINPDLLPEVYDRLYHCSRRYILVSEYYNPTPIEVPYRGHAERMYKRDFAGELLDRFPDLELLDYGFRYRRDNNFPADDGNWFLLGR